MESLEIRKKLSIAGIIAILVMSLGVIGVVWLAVFISSNNATATGNIAFVTVGSYAVYRAVMGAYKAYIGYLYNRDTAV
jgi:hypothetical protein